MLTLMNEIDLTEIVEVEIHLHGVALHFFDHDF